MGADANSDLFFGKQNELLSSSEAVDKMSAL